MAEVSNSFVKDALYWNGEGVAVNFCLITTDDIRSMAENMRGELGDYLVDGLSEADLSRICEEVGYGSASALSDFIAQAGAKMGKETRDRLLALKEARDGGWA